MTAAKANALLVAKNSTDNDQIDTHQEIQTCSLQVAISNPEQWTIDSLWEDYKKYTISKQVRIDEWHYKKHIYPVFGDLQPSQINIRNIDNLKLNLRKAHLKPATIRKTLQLLGRICNYGHNKELCAGLTFKLAL